MLTYDAPDDLAREIVVLDDLPADWRRQETLTQRLGDDWHRAGATPLLQVPSVVVPLVGSPDQNVLINHAYPDVTAIRRIAAVPFTLDVRLFMTFYDVPRRDSRWTLISSSNCSRRSAE